MKAFLTSLAVTVALLLTSSPYQVAAAEYDYDLDDNQSPHFNGPLHLRVGDTLRLVVDENLSTGYEWIYQSHADRGILDEEAAVYSVSMDEHRHHTLSNSNGEHGYLAGAGGTRVIQLEAENPGTDTFEIIYAKAWELKEDRLFHENDNAGHHRITIEVTAE